MSAAPDDFSLPLAVATRTDVSRLVRELTGLDDYLAQAAIRRTGTPMNLPRTSRLLEETASSNGLNLLDEATRTTLNKELVAIRDNAPIIHASFAADPSAAFLQKIVQWFRAEIHPLALMQVGLQPGIAAGCTIRTSSRYFDLSLRSHFDDQRALLIEKIGAQRG